MCQYCAERVSFTDQVLYSAVCNVFTQTPSTTANYPASVVEHLPPSLASGVYCGWAQVARGPAYPMVMSVGWNPHFQNKERSMVPL